MDIHTGVLAWPLSYKRKPGEGRTAANAGLLHYANDSTLHELMAELARSIA